MIRSHNRRAATTAAVLCACAGTAFGQAQVGATWIGNGGNWFDGTNWDAQPGSGFIPDNGVTYTWWVLITAGQLCNIDGNPTIDRIGMSPSTTLNQFNNRTFTIVGDTDGSGAYGTFSIVGATYQMSSVGNNTDLVVTGGPTATLFIGGEINDDGLIQMSNHTQNRIYGASGVETIHFTRDLEVWGSGNIGVNSARVVNEDCVIRATQSQPLILDPANTLEFLNESFCIAEFDGTLQLNGGTFNNTNGWIGANAPDARLLLNGGTIDGGHVQSGSGLLQFHGGSIINTTTILGHISTGEGGGLCTSPTSVEDITNYGTLRIANNVSGLRVKDEIRNFNLISFESVGNNTDLILDTDTVLTSGGEVMMSNVVNNRIFGANTDIRFTNLNNWIHGSGNICVNTGRLTNQGVIECDIDGGTMIIDPFGDDSINFGTFRASNGGTVEVRAATYDQTSQGLIEALDDSLVELQECTIIGGTYDTTGTGIVRVDGNAIRLIGATNTGLIEIPNNRSGLRLQNTFHNTGTVRHLSVGNTTDVILETDVTVTGGGIFEMQSHGSANNRIYSTGGPFTFNNVDNTIRGDGAIGLNATIITNAGTFSANAPGQELRIDPSSICTNNGLMEGTNGGRLRLQGGTHINTSGSIRARTGSAVEFEQCVVDGGDIRAESGGHLDFDGGYTINTIPVIEPGATGVMSSSGGGCMSGLTNHGVLTFSNNVSSTRFGGPIHNTGTIFMDSVGNTTDLRLVDDLTLTGGGDILMDNHGSANNRIFHDGGAFTLTNIDNLIHGDGAVGINSLMLDNEGVIDADINGRELRIDLSGATSRNAGVMRASNGGILRMQQSTIDQSDGGILDAQNDSTVRHENETIIGGSLTSSGTGQHYIEGSSTRFIDVANLGVIEIPNNRAARIQSTFHNDATVNLRTIGNTTDLICEGDTVISGTGEIVLHDNSSLQNRMYGTSGTVITLQSTLRGSGRLGLNSTHVINQGQVLANGAFSLEIDPFGSAPGFQNEGLLHASGTADLRVLAGVFSNMAGGEIRIDAGSTLRKTSGPVEQAGGLTSIMGTLAIDAGAFVQSGGQTDVAGVLTPSGGVTITGGEFGGAGLVFGSVTNTSGDVVPGESTGSRFIDDLTITGNYTQSDQGEFTARLLAEDINTGLFVGGTSSIQGTLEIRADAGFTPELGQQFTIMNASSITGDFSNIVETNFPVGLGASVDVGAVSIVVTIVKSGCDADWNQDSVFNTSDFVAYLNDFNAVMGGGSFTYQDPDIGAPIGVLNTADFVAYLNLFSTGCD